MPAAKDDLREQIIELGPWHYDVDVADDVSTRVSLEAPPGTYPASYGPVDFAGARVRDWFKQTLSRIYPGGLEGRSVLDCACNCGAYLFWARELGAGECFGFDVREHWIRQARFLLEHRTGGAEGMRFEVRDLYDLPSLGLDRFDVVLFNGIFYHLPDPVTGLRIAADLTKELIVVNTTARPGGPTGSLALGSESTEQLLSGTYGLNWYPTGPEVLHRILEWAGFAQTRLVWRKATGERLVVMASRTPGLLDAVAID